MKTPMSWLVAQRLAVLLLLLLFCCSNPDEEDITPPTQGGQPLTPAEADAALESFQFSSSKKINGSVPTVANTSLVKTDNGDTIYVLPGIKNIIQVSHPEGRPIKGVYFAASGSAFYYDVPALAEQKEESDTISLIIFEIDPDDLDGTLHVPIEITPYDESEQPIDILERIITVEDPSDKSKGCSILQSGDTTTADGFSNTAWSWRWSMILDMNDQIVNMTIRGKPHRNDFTYQGCCKGTACPTQYLEGGIRKWKYDKEFDLHTVYTIAYEIFQFYKNGTFYRRTNEISSYLSNADDDTDWCTVEPVISDRFQAVDYYGTHDYAPGDARIFYSNTHTSCAASSMCGYASSGGDVTATCNSMIISSTIEGQRSIRLYSKFYGATGPVIEDDSIIRGLWKK